MTTAADMATPPELTLIVAATRNMGIGRAGTLPWTGLRKEMAYFARVTKRLPVDANPQALNAVIMGRKTWESIPPRFRPLKGRLNLVVSRSHTEPPAPVLPAPGGLDPDAEPARVASLAQALEYLSGEVPSSRRGGKAFVIGGAQIYGAALAEQPEAARRVLLTRILGDFECDTFFPLDLSTEGAAAARGWARRGKAELDAWVGEEVPGGVQEEAGTEYEFEMWERDGKEGLV